MILDVPTEPSSIGLHPSRLSLVFALLESSGLDNLSVFVTDRLPSIEHFKTSRLFCITVKVFSFHPFEGDIGG